MQQIEFLRYLPICTTILSAFFAANIYNRYKNRGGGNHLLWWSAGVLIYGLGTFTESWITLLGWNPVIFKLWYISGALLGGAPLAQGTVWLLLKHKPAMRWTIFMVSYVFLASIFIIASPVNLSLVNPHLPSGSVFRWQWVRAFSPVINLYAVIFLIGGAALSAWRFGRYSYGSGQGNRIAKDRFIGNVLIACGAILPGIGGASSRAGHTEILYIMELMGISLIWLGYWYNVRSRPVKSD